MMWYFYAGPCEYYCKFDEGDPVPARFHGPFESKAEAEHEYQEWRLTQMEQEVDEFAE